MRFDIILFDLDGTLLDTKKGILLAVAETIKKYERKIPNQTVLEGMIGPPIQVSFKNLYGISDADAMGMANVFRKIYMEDDYLLQAEPYAGINDLLESLIQDGIKVGIATYKREDYAKRLLCEKGFNKFTDFMYGSDFSGMMKKADIIQKCLNDIGCVDLSKSVYIGDGDSDGKGANEVGMNFIGVTYGFGFKSARDAANYNPIEIADNCYQLREILRL